MPISPQDFELYSRMTGRSLPRDPAERMRMAPEVYDFTRNFGREPNVLQKAGNLVGAIGKDIGGTLLSGIGYGVQRSNQLADTQQQQEFELVQGNQRLKTCYGTSRRRRESRKRTKWR